MSISYDDNHYTTGDFIGDFVLSGILNVLPGLSLFALVFIYIFPTWLMGAYDFCSSCSGFMEDKFFSLSLMLFGGRIDDLCNGCFCFDNNIGSLPIPNPLLSWCLVKFGRVKFFQILLEI